MGLELIKQKQALVHNPNDKELKRSQKHEIQNYLAWIEEQQREDYLKDVYVTDNKPKTPKYNVNNEKELDAFMKYQESLESYNTGNSIKPKSAKQRGKYRKGSLAQKVFEPMISAEKNEDGTYYMFVDQQDLYKIDEEALKEKWEVAQKTNEVCEGDPEDADWNWQLTQDLEEKNISLDKWNSIIADELGVFKKDEEYDYVTDLRRNFDDVLAETKFDKIFKTIPEHVFWDIKRPLHSNL